MPHRLTTTLDQAAIDCPLIIHHVSATPDWQHWLEEIGFIAGEHVVVKKRSFLKGGAMVVRVGLSTFALHPSEAACVVVTAVEGL